MEEERRKPMTLLVMLFFASVCIVLGMQLMLGVDIIGEIKTGAINLYETFMASDLRREITGPAQEYGYIDNSNHGGHITPSAEEIAMDTLDEITESVSGMTFNEMEKYLLSLFNGQ